VGGTGGDSPRQGKWFATTQWSVVLRAGSTEAENQTALATLCQVYWRPVHSYIRCRGYDADTALDLTQGFFAELLERRGLEAASRERGRFRNFLLVSVKNFLSHERERDQAQKRGGGRSPISIDADPESSFAGVIEPATHETPETIFERGWAMTLLDQTMLDLRADVEQSGSLERFETLRPYLVSETEPPYPELARELKLTESAVRVALHRLRQRFGSALRERVAQTLEDPGRVEDELRYLIGLMGA
jgi:DNA-directed RNA polymerase specialized sigma24 family protein